MDTVITIMYVCIAIAIIAIIASIVVLCIHSRKHDTGVKGNTYPVYARIMVDQYNIAKALAIMTDNDILQTKYIAGGFKIDLNKQPSIGDSIHIIIDDVGKHAGVTMSDAQMDETTTITINGVSDSKSNGFWTSTIEPENMTVELLGKVVEVNGNIITAKCESETIWDKYVFNRLPMRSIMMRMVTIGRDNTTNRVLFGTDSFTFGGSADAKWMQCDVTGDGSSLTIGEHGSIKDLPESFVSHWVDTIRAKAWIGKDEYGDGYIMLVSDDQ